jgi:hypothetical protein
VGAKTWKVSVRDEFFEIGITATSRCIRRKLAFNFPQELSHYWHGTENIGTEMTFAVDSAQDNREFCGKFERLSLEICLSKVQANGAVSFDR